MNLCLFTSWVQGEALVEFFWGMASMTDNSKRTGAAIEAHYHFLARLVPTIEKFPKSHNFTIGDRIKTIALDVLEALVAVHESAAVKVFGCRPMTVARHKPPPRENKKKVSDSKGLSVIERDQNA